VLFTLLLLVVVGLLVLLLLLVCLLLVLVLLILLLLLVCLLVLLLVCFAAPLLTRPSIGWSVRTQRKEEILQLLAKMLSLTRDQCIEVGLVSRWEHLQPEITASIDAGEAGLSDAFATFLAAEGKST